jgi:hypothetical protein
MRLYSDSDWIRTNDLLLRRQLLYPTELRNQNIFNQRTIHFDVKCIIIHVTSKKKAN